MRGQAECLPMGSQAVLIKSTRDLGGANGQGALFAVNPTTGQRTVLSDFGNAAQGPTGLAPEGVVVCNGLAGLGTTIYVVDKFRGDIYSRSGNGQPHVVKRFRQWSTRPRPAYDAEPTAARH
jgi:uncharacterized repeat protein (TIGR03803 family)